MKHLKEATRTGLALMLATLTMSANAALIHRYSFTSDASDSVGSAHGTLNGNASISGGAVHLDGTSSTYVRLLSSGAGGININTLTSLTIEAWWSHTSIPDSPGPFNGQRVFDFGKAGTTGTDYLYYTPTAYNSGLGQVLGMSDDYWNNEKQVNQAPMLAVDTLWHMAAVIDGTTLSYYLNGAFVGSVAAFAPSVLSNTDAFLGKSVYDGDPAFAGSITEFRVYNSALSASEIQQNFTLGPDAIPPGGITTTTTLVSSANPASLGSNVTFTATVRNEGVPATDATGTVTFEVDGSPASVEAVVNGVATYSTSALAVGNRTINAIYSGDTVYDGSSNSLVQTITDSPYDIWADGYELVGGPDDDDDGDGMTNFQEFAFGLVPTSGASVNPVTDTSDLTTLGQFSYTRFANSGLTYTIWTSVDLIDWDEAEASVQEPGEADESTGAQSVLVEVNPMPGGNKVFVRVMAE